MVRDDLCITVPTFFRCPISLDVMKSPVSLSTGVTYDRSSIQRWLDAGNNTCPATMQLLDTNDFVPNHNLQRLIKIWTDSLGELPPPDPDSDSPSTTTSVSPSISQNQARDLANRISGNNSHNCLESLTKLASFAAKSDANRRFLAAIEGFPALLVQILRRGAVKDLNLADEAVRVLDMILEKFKGDREKFSKSAIKTDFMNSMLLLLQRGSLASRIATARVLNSMAIDAETKLFIAEHGDALSQLLRLVSSESDPSAIEAGLCCLISVSMTKRIRSRLVRLGSVRILGKMLSEDSNANSKSKQSVSAVEKVMKLLEMAASCREGRREMSEDENCVAGIVRKLLKVSSGATENGVMILWSLCYLFQDRMAQEAVTKNNGLTKILLLLQSNCSPAVRQMSADLLKIFRVNSKSCLSSYDTKTTHIMPF